MCSSDLSDRARRWQQRQHLRALEGAVYGGWAVKPEDYETIPRDLRSIAGDENASPRDRIRATEALMWLEQKKIENSIQLDRIYRLEAGEATDRMEVVTDMADAALEAVARSIAAIAPDTPALRPPCRKPKRLPKPRD